MSSANTQKTLVEDGLDWKPCSCWQWPRKCCWLWFLLWMEGWKLLNLEIFEFRCFSTTLWSLLKSIEGEYSLELEKRLKLKKWQKMLLLEVSIAVSATVTDPTEDVKAMSPERRKCLLESETSSSLYKVHHTHGQKLHIPELSVKGSSGSRKLPFADFYF